MTKLQITLDQAEASLLAEWAASELRDPRDQIRLLVQRALELRALEQAGDKPRSQPTSEADHADTLDNT